MNDELWNSSFITHRSSLFLSMFNFSPHLPFIILGRREQIHSVMNPILIHSCGSLFLKKFKNRGHGMLFFLAKTNLQQFVLKKQALCKQFVYNVFLNVFPHP